MVTPCLNFWSLRSENLWAIRTTAVALLFLASTLAAGAATLADLVPQNTNVTPSTVSAGSTITVSYTVRNQGGTNAPASHTKVQIKNPSGVQVTAPVFSTSAISAGSSVNESRVITIPAGSPSGTYNAYVIVDNNSEVNQSNTSNDFGPARSFTVQAAATLADLLPQNTSVSPSTVTAGNTITVTYTVRNQGGTNAPASHTKVQIKNPSGVQVTAPVFSTPAINAGSSVNESRVITIPAGSPSGTYNAYVIVDNNSEVNQSNTSNDFGPARSFTVQAAVTLADLLPQNTSVSPSTVTAGNTITVTYTVRNQGGTNAPASHTKVQIKNPSGVQVTAPVFSTPAIGANSSVNESRVITIPAGSPSGTYNAYVIVDNNSEVSQSNTSNDLGPAKPFTVQAAVTLADLLPQNTSVSPSTVTAGNTITVSYTVRNQGGTNAPASHTKVQIKNPSGVEITAPVFSTPAISANSSINESRVITIPAGSSSGTYNAFVIVDNNSEVSQSNASNDLGPASPFTVQSTATLADLVPQNASVTPSTVTPGNTITVSYTVRNQGGTNAPASHTKVQIKNPSGVEITAPVFSTTAIGANSSVNENRVINIPANSISGTYNAYVIVDNNSEVTQSNSTNDLGSATPFTVQTTATLADLLPQNTNITPATVTTGNSITVSYTVRNQGGTNAPASHTKVQIKNPSGVEITAPVFSTLAISANSSVNESRVITIPSGSAAGTYNAYVIVDNNSEVNQSNTSNDLGPATPFAVTIGGAPPGPFSLSANVRCNTSSSPIGPAVLLTWSNSAGAASYQVFRNDVSYASNIQGTTFENTASVSPGQTYSYFVRATNANGSSNTNTVPLSVPADICSSLQPPGNFTLTGVARCGVPPSPNVPLVSLTWTAAPRASWYQVFRDGYIVSEDLSTNSFDNTNVSAGQTYSFQVRAVNSSGISPSNPVSISVPSGTCQPPSSLKLVVLGDSYSSGEGTFVYDYGFNPLAPHPCHRSREYTWGGSSPGRQTSISVPGFTGTQVERKLFACSGAKVRDFCSPRTFLFDTNEIPQTKHPELKTADMVAFTIGGNDALFVLLLKECIKDLGGDCRTRVPSGATKTLEELRDESISRLEEVLPIVYSIVRSEAGNASVFALGYPMILPESFSIPCIVDDFISSAEREFLRETGAKLDATIRAAAETAGIHFVPVAGAVEPSSQRFIGHEVCGSGFDWIWGLGPLLDPSLDELFHPKLRGYQAVAAILKEYISVHGGGSTLPPNPGPAIAKTCDDLAAVQAQARALGLSSGHESGSLSVRLTGLSCNSRSYLVRSAGIEVAGDAFQPLSPVTLRLEVGETYSAILATVTADSQGNLLWNGSVPPGAPLTGDGFIKATGTTPLGGSRTLYRTVRMSASTTSDQDSDSVPDICDNCAAVPNGSQEDSDRDGVGNVCDLCPNDEDNDSDGDGLCGDVDICPFDPLNDFDGDGTCANFDLSIFNDGFEAGDVSRWSGWAEGASATLPSPRFSDNFDDGVYDPTKWTWTGNTVRELGGELHVDREVTDNGGGADSATFPVESSGLITVTRRTRVFAANQFFDGSLIFVPGGLESRRFGVSYANYSFSQGGECPVQGFALYRNNANSHQCQFQGTDVTNWIPGIWGQWFQERFDYDPQNGMFTYWINGTQQLQMNVGPLPADAATLQLRLSTWGWHTGHYQHTDDLVVDQVD